MSAGLLYAIYMTRDVYLGFCTEPSVVGIKQTKAVVINASLPSCAGYTCDSVSQNARKVGKKDFELHAKM